MMPWDFFNKLIGQSIPGFLVLLARLSSIYKYNCTRPLVQVWKRSEIIWWSNCPSSSPNTECQSGRQRALNSFLCHWIGYLTFLGKKIIIRNVTLTPLRHRRSIEGLRQEREQRLQTSRRARSLSPSQLLHPESAFLSKASAGQPMQLPQQLRQEVNDSTRWAAPRVGTTQRTERKPCWVFVWDFNCVYYLQESSTHRVETDSVTLGSCCGTTTELERRPERRSQEPESDCGRGRSRRRGGCSSKSSPRRPRCTSWKNT